MPEPGDDETDDSTYIERVLDGEHEAFSMIVLRYETRVFSLLHMMIQDRHHAEDVMQDVFMRAYANLSTFDLRRPFYPWLATIAVRLSINRIQQLKRTDGRLEELNDIAANGDQPDKQAELDEQKNNIWRDVAGLTHGERTAVMLFYNQELTVTEIAGVLGVTRGTVKTLLHRGRQRLKRELTESGET